MSCEAHSSIRRCDHNEVSRLIARWHVFYESQNTAGLKNTGMNRIIQRFEPLAQLVEHRPFKPGVLGSIPRRLKKLPGRTIS
jgi:hypothetical protein